ncbi:uncharacterized protein LOC128193491 [Vigna angularis]|uniref:uncharacterized protein LOC128193491 n=1 Tax=Phaseolus angularis TaxID=3914 RepID=UPI0022B5245A|nr:uncharacterized protein LOC128193491 [Vigna angularis]
MWDFQQVKNENPIEVIETSTMTIPQGRGVPQGRGGGRSNRGRGGRSIRPQCTYCNKIGHTRDKCYILHGYPDKVAHVSKAGDLESRISNEEYEEFLRYKSGKSFNPGQSSAMTSVPTTNLSKSVEGHNPWILDSGASDHISGTWDRSSDWRRT